MYDFQSGIAIGITVGVGATAFIAVVVWIILITLPPKEGGGALSIDEIRASFYNYIHRSWKIRS